MIDVMKDAVMVVISIFLLIVMIAGIIRCECETSDYPFCDNPKCKNQTHSRDKSGNLKRL